jgi:hypothetical protein
MRQKPLTYLLGTGAHFFIGGIFSSLSNERMSPVLILPNAVSGKTIFFPALILYACKPKGPV